ncbi:fumarylacetoacetate hydrolase family protein [Bosea sp. (in: a-proteobacteria)]
MKLGSIDHEGCPRLVALDGEALVLLPKAFGDLVDVATGGAEALAALAAAAAAPDAQRLPLTTGLGAPIRRFRRDILCTGWNYHAHFDESVGKRGAHEVERPEAPTFFTKGPDVVIGPTDAIAYDARLSACWDYEAEVALVIGRTIRSPSSQEAQAAVFGYCLANDVSQRDLQRRHGGQWLKGKSIDDTMPLGPFLVTADEVDIGAITLECFVNGELRQRASTAQMAFPVGELLAELARGMTLRPGDVVLTGTPAGIGSARTPPVFLQAGDEVVVRGSGLGELRNRLQPTDLAGKTAQL